MMKNKSQMSVVFYFSIIKFKKMAKNGNKKKKQKNKIIIQLISLLSCQLLL